MLKAEHQKRYLEAGYWRGECIRFKRRRYRHKCRLLLRNPDCVAIFDGLKGGVIRILDLALNLRGEMLECLVNELEACFDNVLCGTI